MFVYALNRLVKMEVEVKCFDNKFQIQVGYICSISMTTARHLKVSVRAT